MSVNQGLTKFPSVTTSMGKACTGSKQCACMMNHSLSVQTAKCVSQDGGAFEAFLWAAPAGVLTVHFIFNKQQRYFNRWLARACI